ncbi:MAG: glucose 1-dehydrogenase [Alphaproteobacteria bacterium]|nr:glucose 1-dehydrogenase [Alphaproteobacteria bacterium]
MMRLSGKVAIVTGGAQGIGAAYARALALEGACVTVADILDPHEVVMEISAAGGRAIGLQIDVSSENDCRRMVAETVEAFGRLDVLVNNAAIFASLERKPFTEIAAEEWDRVMAVNIRGPFLCAQAAVPVMRAQKSGKIINVSSGTVFSGTPGMLHYVSSKGAQIAFTRALAREVGDDGICVNAIAPGLTMSEGLLAQKDSLSYTQTALGARALKREQVPADLIGALLYLASSDSDFVIGQTLVVDGGYVMH